MTATVQVQRPAFARFANPGVVCEGWYPVARASAVGKGGVLKVDLAGRDLVLWRDHAGALRCIERACPHLGADLSKGTVTGDGLQCAFHAWCWDGDGACGKGAGAAEGRRARTYAVEERWGLAWVFAGGAPTHDLPLPDPANRARVLALPEQRLACHPHVMLGNGLDVTHVVPVHKFRFEGHPHVRVEPPHRIGVEVHARFAPTWMRTLLGLSGKDARWTFTNVGPSLAWVKVTHPTPFELLWAGRPLAGGGTAAQTVFFLPDRRSLVRALPMMVATTWADRKVLDGLDFRPGFVPSDAVFERYARLVEGMPAWA